MRIKLRYSRFLEISFPLCNYLKFQKILVSIINKRITVGLLYMIKSSVYDKPQGPVLFEIRLCHSYSKFFFERTSKTITCSNIIKAETKVKCRNERFLIRYAESSKNYIV